MSKPILSFYKKAEKSTHKIKIPKVIIDTYGYEYLIVVSEEGILLKPIQKEEK